jgi:hypothetical protein
MLKNAADIVRRRAELMTQLFLGDIGASVWTAHPEIGPFDSIAVFMPKDGKLRMVAVEIKATEQPVSSEFHFHERAETIAVVRHSNVPVLFLIADVKRNRLYFGWASQLRTGTMSLEPDQEVECRLPVTPAEDSKNELLAVILAQPDHAELATAV